MFGREQKCSSACSQPQGPDKLMWVLWLTGFVASSLNERDRGILAQHRIDPASSFEYKLSWALGSTAGIVLPVASSKVCGSLPSPGGLRESPGETQPWAGIHSNDSEKVPRPPFFCPHIAASVAWTPVVCYSSWSWLDKQHWLSSEYLPCHWSLTCTLTHSTCFYTYDET